MLDGIGETNPHLPALQQTQTLTQPPTSETGLADDPNIGKAARSSVRTLERAPPFRPIGVRMASQMNASVTG